MPQLHRIRGRRRIRALIQRASNAVMPPRSILANRFVSAKLVPLSAEKDYAVQLRPQRATADEELPIPPRELWERWGRTLEWYLSTGRKDVANMLRILESAGASVDDLVRILDFGCAEGRMLRFLPRAAEAEVWGADVNAERIAWAQQHLAPFRFVTTTTAPHLPFEDNHFDLVYCLSVFTHISDLADAWFLELLRIVRPGGLVYVTVHDQHTVELLLGRYRRDQTHRYLVDLLLELDEREGVLSRDWLSFAILADPAAQVFYNSEYLTGKWSRFADCVAVEPEASEYQTALVFRKALR